MSVGTNPAKLARMREHYKLNREKRLQQVREWQAANPFGVSRGKEYKRHNNGAPDARGNR